MKWLAGDRHELTGGMVRPPRATDPMHRWADEVEKRRGTRVAVLALARKLAGILFAIRRDGTVYEPSRSGAIELATPATCLVRRLLKDGERVNGREGTMTSQNRLRLRRRTSTYAP